MVLHMDKGPGNQGQLGRARHFLHCVILEQRAATEELKASNAELERLLEEILSTRRDLRQMAKDDAGLPISKAPPSREPGERSVTELKREVAAVLEMGATAIQESMRLRQRSRKIRAALQKQVKTPPAGQGLSKREHQVLTLIVAGKSSKEIAAELGISFKTAVTHRASIMSKLDVHEIASVVREAIRRGLV
jgi:DNA-binding NarL/FixJ family response regulator